VDAAETAINSVEQNAAAMVMVPVGVQ